MNRFAPASHHGQRRLGSLIVAAGSAALAVVLIGCGDRHDHQTHGNPPVQQEASPSTQATATPADNTAKNERDRNGALTPLDQGNSDADIATTQAIRKAVVADRALSINAQNVKIITNNGVVTLRGPVNTEAERSAVVAAAQRTSGVRSVNNHLEVAR